MIAFDIDGVIADIMYMCRLKCDLWFGHPYDMTKETTYDMSWALGCPPSEVENYVNWCMTCVEEMPIDPYAVKLTEALYRDTHKAILFVTHRHQNPMRRWTYDLINKWITVPYSIAFAKNNKAPFIPAGYRFVEDRRATAIDLAEQGIDVFLITTQYNVLEPSQKTDKIHRVKDLKEIYGLYY